MFRCQEPPAPASSWPMTTRCTSPTLGSVRLKTSTAPRSKSFLDELSGTRPLEAGLPPRVPSTSMNTLASVPAKRMSEVCTVIL